MRPALRGCVAALVAFVAACGGEPAAPPEARLVEGAVIKGAVQGATVKFFTMDAAGNVIDPANPVATVTTDAAGRFAAALPNQGVHLLAQTFDGSYADESDPATGPARRRIALPATPTVGFEAVLPPNATSLAITPYSHALLIKARLQAAGANFFNVFDAVRLQATQAFGFDPITTVPADPLSPAATATLAQRQYALLLGAAAQAINAIAASGGRLPDFTDVTAFINDLGSDGIFDLVNIDDQLRRFRNNNFGLYGDVALPVLNQALLSQPADVPNEAPVANADAILVSEGGVATVLSDGSTTSVLANDTDVEGSTLTAAVATAPARGSLVLNTDGTFSYTHDGSEAATDSFTYRANDGTDNSTPATVTISVSAVNDAPVAVDDPGYAGAVGGTVTVMAGAGGVRDNDTDADDPVTDLTVNTSPVSAPSFASSFSLAADGTFSYQHDGSANLVDSFTYEVCDDGLPPLCDQAVATITLSSGAAGEVVLPYLTNAGELKLFDPADPGNPVLVESGLSVTDFTWRTLMKASVTGGVASNIAPARIVYISSDRTIKKVNLEPGQSRLPVQVSNIADACRINGIAEDFVNPDNSVVRIDTAGANTLCEDGSGDDFNTAFAWLVPLSTGAGSPGVQVGFGHCCGITAIGTTSGTLTGVMSAEDDGSGGTFFLRRRNLGTLATPAFSIDLEIAGSGSIYGALQRGMGDTHVYVRAVRFGVETTYKILRFNVAANTLTEVYDYGVSDGTLFEENFDHALSDAANIYFLKPDGSELLAIPHTATTATQFNSLFTPPGGTKINGIGQAGNRIAIEASSADGTQGGVYSVLKAGGGQVQLAANNAAPTTNRLRAANGSLVLFDSISGTTGLTYAATALTADGLGGFGAISDAQWAGEVFQTTCDFNEGCEDSVLAQALYLRRLASTSEAQLELADLATGAPTGTYVGSIFNVFEGPAAFVLGFGAYGQVTVLASTEQSDLFLADSGQASATPPGTALVPVANDPGGDNRWLLFGDGDDGGGGGGSTDSDFDGLTDDQELALGTDPFNPDSDFDGLSDFDEVARDGNPGDFNPGAGDTDPTNHDTDADGALDGDEVNVYITDPLNPDSDADDIGDGLELFHGSDPLVDESLKLYVDGSGAGTDTNDGLSWATAIATNDEVFNRQAVLDSSRGPDGLVYVLYQGDPASPTVYGTFSFVVNISNVVLIGSLGPGRPVPANWSGGPPAGGELGTVFDSFGDGGVVDVSAAAGSLDSIVLTGGSAFPDGGGLRASGGSSVFAWRVLISGNQAGDGGGVSVGSSDSLQLVHSTVENNVAVGNSSGGLGGGIYNLGSLTLSNTRVSGNTASRLDATNFGLGGGLYTEAGATASMSDSLVAGNIADGAGGGLFVATTPAAGFSDVTVQSSTIDNNQALRPLAGDSGGNGGGICAVGPMSVIDSVVSNNTAEASFSLNGTLQGGGGINAFYGVVLDNSKVVGNRATQGAGGGMLIGNGTILGTTVQNATFADNHAFGGPGGGLNLVDVANPVVRDSRFLSNSSSGFPGAGLHLHMAGDATIFNNLFLGNHSDVTNPGQPGGGVEIENFQSTPILQFNSNTVAYNQIQISGTAASGGMNVSVGAPTAANQFRNNIVRFNDNADVGTPQAGDNVVLDDLTNPVVFTTQSGNNVDESGFSGSISADPLFEEGFYLFQSSSPSVNGGDALFSTVFGAGTGFTTDAGGAEDAGTVDSGYHHLSASSGTFDSVVLTPPRGLSCASTDTFVFTPSFANAPDGEAGHLIVVELSGVDPTLGSLTTLDPRSSGSRVARDLGDGRYAVDTSGFHLGTATGTFTVYADDQPTPQAFTVSFTNAC